MPTHSYVSSERLTTPVSVHEDIVDAVHARVDKRSVPAYGETTMQSQTEREGLAEMISANEKTHGPLTAEEIRAAEAKMFGDADIASLSRTPPGPPVTITKV
ncbi:hypothetical protein OYE22_29670 [Streptomyces sp. 71268]|uniref:hypothetical protein n=1 Tax=Streptomyces sp. 71268 TaxID=3002640 RepID=UPI0023F92955|nr:hypothetical protein [Streptomyces sp. 71268]WEV28889.1 hypothetical protein OYE22_29670 [Streptomyces sp. 71268]